MPRFPRRGTFVPSLKMIKNPENSPFKHARTPAGCGLQLVDSWSSRPGDSFAGLPKCPRGAGQKQVSCAGQRAPARTVRAAQGGVPVNSDPGTPPVQSAVSHIGYLNNQERRGGPTPGHHSGRQLCCRDPRGRAVCPPHVGAWSSAFFVGPSKPRSRADARHGRPRHCTLAWGEV